MVFSQYLTKSRYKTCYTEKQQTKVFQWATRKWFMGTLATPHLKILLLPTFLCKIINHY